MALPPTPENKKENQHVVPRFWQRRFAGSDGRIFARYRVGSDPTGRCKEDARQAGVDSTMTQEWTYTVFDRWWRPSQALEDQLSKLEGRLSRTLEALDAPGTIPNPKQSWELCVFVGLAACRTPEVMARLHRRMKELARALSDAVEAESFEQFSEMIRTRFGVVLTEDDFVALRQRPGSALADTATAIGNMSPQNPILPEQLALTGIEMVASQVSQMDLELLDAPSSHHFILGDTPLPDSDLAKGFTVPLSRSLALRAEPGAGAGQPPNRRIINGGDVSTINIAQFAQARDVVIGPDKQYLDGLA